MYMSSRYLVDDLDTPTSNDNSRIELTGAFIGISAPVPRCLGRHDAEKSRLAFHDVSLTFQNCYRRSKILRTNLIYNLPSSIRGLNQQVPTPIGAEYKLYSRKFNFSQNTFNEQWMNHNIYVFWLGQTDRCV